MTYVRPWTTQEEILRSIEQDEEELRNPTLSDFDREAIEDHLDYLYSFITEN